MDLEGMFSGLANSWAKKESDSLKTSEVKPDTEALVREFVTSITKSPDKFTEQVCRSFVKRGLLVTTPVALVSALFRGVVLEALDDPEVTVADIGTGIALLGGGGHVVLFYDRSDGCTYTYSTQITMPGTEIRACTAVMDLLNTAFSRWKSVVPVEHEEGDVANHIPEDSRKMVIFGEPWTGEPAENQLDVLTRWVLAGCRASQNIEAKLDHIQFVINMRKAFGKD
jgi:hypothetical protein